MTLGGHAASVFSISKPKSSIFRRQPKRCLSKLNSFLLETNYLGSNTEPIYGNEVIFKFLKQHYSKKSRRVEFKEREFAALSAQPRTAIRR